MRILLLLILAVLAVLVFSQSGVLRKHAFETDPEGWIPMGTGGSVSVTHNPTDVKTGTGAMALTYDLVLVMGALGSMKRLRTWSSQTTIPPSHPACGASPRLSRISSYRAATVRETVSPQPLGFHLGL